MGFHANVAVFEDKLNANIVVVAACDLQRGECLVRPIDFLKRLKANRDMDLELWRRQTEQHLSDADKALLGVLWKDFEETHKWRKCVVHRDTERLMMTLVANHYQRLFLALYRSALSQELIFPVHFLLTDKRVADRHQEVLHIVFLVMDIVAHINDTSYCEKRLASLKQQNAQRYAVLVRDSQLLQWLSFFDFVES